MRNPSPHWQPATCRTQQEGERRNHQQNPQRLPQPQHRMADVWRGEYDDRRKYRNLRASN